MHTHYILGLVVIVGIVAVFVFRARSADNGRRRQEENSKGQGLKPAERAWVKAPREARQADRCFSYRDRCETVYSLQTGSNRQCDVCPK